MGRSVHDINGLCWACGSTVVPCAASLGPPDSILKYKPLVPRSYLRFAIENRRFISFGFLIALASSFGQTYFIGVFGPSIESEFGLSHTGWSSIYLYGTLASAIVLPWSGKLLDHIPLPRYTVSAVALLAIGAGLISAAHNVWLLALCIFVLRQGGQGLMSHISVTSMARYYEAGRGRAIALATLGFAAGEAILPFLALAAIASLGWRTSFASVAVALLLVVLPCSLWLLRGHTKRHDLHLSDMEQGARSPGDAKSSVRSWTRSEVLKDYRFYLLLPALLAPAMIVTALFFWPQSLAEAKGWSTAWITGSYAIYAAATTVVALWCGPLIDRVGGKKLVPFMLLPMVLSLLVVGTLREPWVVWPYFLLLGGSIGISHTAVSAMWAELYGIGSIGAIKSVVTALAVLSSAIGPVIVGRCMDLGIGIEKVCLGFAGYAFLATLLLVVALRSHTRA